MRIDSPAVGIGKKAGDAVVEILPEAFIIFFIDQRDEEF
jgi:hypothetical protein